MAVDTTVQPTAVAHSIDARLMYRAIEKLTALAKREAVPLRQSDLRVAKRAAIMVGRYTHAHQFKRARREPHAKECTATSSMATRSDPWSSLWNASPASRRSASMSTGLDLGPRSGVSPRPSAAR